MSQHYRTTVSKDTHANAPCRNNYKYRDNLTHTVISAYHGIPGWQNDRIARFIHLDKVLGCNRFVHDNLVDEPERV